MTFGPMLYALGMRSCNCEMAYNIAFSSANELRVILETAFPAKPVVVKSISNFY